MSWKNRVGLGALTLLLLMGSQSRTHAQLRLSVGNLIGDPGRSITVPIELTADGTTGLQFELGFDNNFLTVEQVAGGSALADHQLFSNEIAPGTLRVIVFSQTQSALSDGEVVTVDFAISADIESAESALDLSDVELVDASAESIKPEQVESGSLVVPPPPSISAIADQTTEMNVPTSTISFTIRGEQFAAEDLTLTKTSSNSSLAPEGNITLGGSGADRTLRITPVLGQTGESTIEIIVTNPRGREGSVSFLLTVVPAAGIEGDVVPLPDGDGRVTISDWVKIGRFVIGLDEVTTANQFMRADTAPRVDEAGEPILGNGALSLTDWVQAGRYAIGLDPPADTGGPIGPFGSSSEE